MKSLRKIAFDDGVPGAGVERLVRSEQLEPRAESTRHKPRMGRPGSGLPFGERTGPGIPAQPTDASFRSVLAGQTAPQLDGPSGKNRHVDPNALTGPERIGSEPTIFSETHTKEEDLRAALNSC